jgi:hypothetical protein
MPGTLRPSGVSRQQHGQEKRECVDVCKLKIVSAREGKGGREREWGGGEWRS